MAYSVSIVGTTDSFYCSAHQTVLQGAQNANAHQPLLINIPTGCQGGGCGVCRIKVWEGKYEALKMSRKHVSEEERAAGIALACRVYPKTDLIVEVFPHKSGPLSGMVVRGE